MGDSGENYNPNALSSTQQSYQMLSDVWLVFYLVGGFQKVMSDALSVGLAMPSATGQR
jgi:hypothetical protein